MRNIDKLESNALLAFAEYLTKRDNIPLDYVGPKVSEVRSIEYACFMYGYCYALFDEGYKTDMLENLVQKLYEEFEKSTILSRKE